MPQLPVFTDEVPGYECRDGRMHISLGGLELVMPISVFATGLAKSQRELDRWYENQGSVLPFRRKR